MYAKNTNMLGLTSLSSLHFPSSFLFNHSVPLKIFSIFNDQSPEAASHSNLKPALTIFFLVFILLSFRPIILRIP